MAFVHQKERFQVLGTGARFSFTASGTGMKARHRFTGHSYILDSVSLMNNVVGVTAGKPVITLRKAAEPSTTTATGTALTGGTMTIPAAQAAGSVYKLKTNTAFAEGDQLVIQVSTAATKAMTMYAYCEAHPAWEYVPNTGVTTVTG